MKVEKYLYELQEQQELWELWELYELWELQEVWENGNYGKWGKMKMGSRNLRTQQIWLLNVIIKFGSLMSFDENVEKKEL